MNKVSDKLVPKELAPFLPLASAFIPGLGLGGIFQGLGASPAIAEMLARYSAGQLATGLSSAKMTGEVDPKLQALAGVQSYLQGPIKQTAAETALTKDKELMKQFKEADALAGGTDITDVKRIKELYGQNLIEGATGSENMFGPKMDFLNPFAPGDRFGADTIKSFTDASGNQRFFLPGSDPLAEYLKTAGTAPDFSTLTGDALKEKLVGGTSLTDKTFDTRLSKLQDTLGKERGLTATNKARDFFQDDFGFNKATMAKVGMAATPYIKNEMDIAAKKIEEENAAADAANQSYRDASSALSNFFVNRKPNYDMLYGYNQGGSVKPKRGLVDEPGGYAGMLDYINPLKLKGMPLTGFGINEIIGGMDPSKLSMLEKLFGYNQGGRVGAKDGKFFGSELLGANQISDEPMIGSPAPITNREYILGMGLDPDSMKELGIGGLLRRILSGSGTRSLINAFTGGDMDREKLGKDMNMGGRVGLNMGGMGSIPQTPMVPQGMQLEGRGGGFIPMGAQEKKDDVPAMLAKNEFVMTSDAVRAAGGGSIEKGAQKMYDLMNSLEAQV